MAVLDTTVFVDLHGRGGAAKRLAARAAVQRLLDEDEILMTTRINVAELYVGAYRSDDVEAELRLIADMLAGIVVLELDDDSARRFGQIKAMLAGGGRPIGDSDVFIGSITLVHGETLMTRNLDHYTRIPGLVVQGY